METVVDSPTTPVDASAPAVAAASPTRPRGTRFGSAPTSGFLAFVERRLGLTPIGLAVATGATFMWFGGRVVQSRTLTLAAYGVLAVLLIAWVLGRRSINVTTDRSDVPSRVRVGKPVAISLSLTANRRVSGIIVEEVLDPRLGTSVRVPVPILPSGQSVAHAYSFLPSVRGIFKVGPLVAEWSDPFGLMRRRQEIAPPVELIVHPNTESVTDRISSREWEDPPVRPPISKPWPTGFEFYGMREYVEGDDPRRIVWRAVAQYGKYLVREAEQGITDRVNVYIDSDKAHHSPGPDSQTFETAVAVAASLAAKHLKDGFSVSLDVNSKRLADTYRGQPKLIPMLDHLAAVQPENCPLTMSLDRLFSDRSRSAHNVLVTPHLSREATARLRLLLQRGGSLLLVLVLWDDTDPLAVHRAGALGCNVVEVQAGTPLQAVFARMVTIRR